MRHSDADVHCIFTATARLLLLLLLHRTHYTHTHFEAAEYFGDAADDADGGAAGVDDETTRSRFDGRGGGNNPMNRGCVCVCFVHCARREERLTARGPPTTKTRRRKIEAHTRRRRARSAAGSLVG